jgi:hypothetical protein
LGRDAGLMLAWMMESHDGYGLDGGYYTIGCLKDGLNDGAARGLARCWKSQC